jgi:hypothetical protein
MGPYIEFLGVASFVLILVLFIPMGRKRSPHDTAILPHGQRAAGSAALNRMVEQFAGGSGGIKAGLTTSTEAGR